MTGSGFHDNFFKVMMKKILCLCFGMSWVSSFSYADNFSSFSKLFTLERTLNANQVVYEADLSDRNEPIHPYWNMLAEDGHTEELSRIERSRAYGTEIIEQTPDELKFVIVSFRSHPLTVRIDPETQLPYATIALSGGEKILKNIFLTVVGGIFPKVLKIDVSYQDAKDSQILHEFIDPNAELH